MKLEPPEFIDAYPKENSRDFKNQVNEKFKDMLQNNLEGKNCYLDILYDQLKPKRNKRKIFTVLIMWLYMCFERPWEKEWKDSIKENDPVIYKIYKTLDDFFTENPDFDIPDIQTFRKYLKSENFKEIILSLPIKPILMKLTEILKFAFSPVKMFLDPRTVEQVELISKFINIIESQRWIKKRDLYRKLRIKKDDCDQLLKKAEEGDFIRTKEFTDRTVWITYTNSED